MPSIAAVTLLEPHTAAELERYYALRWKMLRAPWHQPRGSERDARDADSTHLMLVGENGTLIGVGRLHFNSISAAQIRYMAIDTAWQRRGYGSRLLAGLEARARTLGARRVLLDARETALRFYLKHGYKTCGPGHVLFGSVAHVRMEKRLYEVTEPK